MMHLWPLIPHVMFEFWRGMIDESLDMFRLSEIVWSMQQQQDAEILDFKSAKRGAV
jgi:hypothetical protein